MNTKTEQPAQVQNPGYFYWVGLVIVYLLIPLVLIVCGWDWKWWQAWVYSFFVVLAGVGGRWWAEQRHPGLMVERVNLKNSSGIKPWDKLLSPLMSLSISFPMYIVAGLDHHFGWSKVFPVWVNILGLIIIAFGFAFATWALAENRFFSSVVRIQLDRGHQVCDSGPYRFVRHPGYAGNALPLAGMVMAFSSLWTIIPAAAALVIIVTRTALEDQTLQAELPGYKEYSKRVRYRLIPGIW